MKLDQLAYGDWPEKVKPAQINGHAIRSGPTRGAGIARLIDPLHHRTPVDFATEVHITRLGKKPQRHPAGPFPGCSSLGIGFPLREWSSHW